MKLIYLAISIFLCGNVLCKNITILQPPQLNEIQQKKFSEWKNYFLELTAERKEQPFGAKNSPIFLNELIYSKSPYLLQHAHNPVNWKSWSGALLQKAKDENKLIFLSIGYSTCHWCHIMEKESFKDVEIASLINKDYLAIKVDREELPHIDDYYASALEQVKGSAGWPITVIINGDGLPIFIDSYLNKQKLSKLLARVNTVWGKQPDFLLLNAKTIDSMVREGFSPSLREDKKAEIQEKYEQLELNKKLIETLDFKDGGFKGQVKFPSESMILYVLDQLRREGDPQLEKAIKLQLDRMISGGLYDHIGGGFHRYSTDADWMVPHYEKMLYNQAQMIEVYSQAYRFFRKSAYRKVVETNVEFLLKEFYITGKGFATAIDADFNGKEGGYYLWTSQEIENIKELELVKQNINLFKTYSVIDKSSNGAMYGVYFPSALDGSKTDIVEKIRKKLIDIRKTKGYPHVDDKVLTGWNALAIKSLLTAGELLGNQDYIVKAEYFAELLWTKRFDESSGFLSRTGFEDSKSSELLLKRVYLEDYAYFANAIIHLYDVTENIIWLKRAEQIKNAILDNFLDKDGGLFNVSKQSAGLHLKRSSDSELLSPTAVAIDVLSKLERRMGTNLLKRQYSNIIHYLRLKVVADPLNHLYGNLTLNVIERGTTESRRYFALAKGVLKFSCKNYIRDSCSELVINISLDEGWHINSNAPLQDYLVPTKLVSDEGVRVSYPEKKLVKLGFQEGPLSVYQGQFNITIQKTDNHLTREFFTLPLQACSHKLCLLPEKFIFSM